MAVDFKTLDLEATVRDKVLYVVVALPLLIAIGVTLRALGFSEAATNLIVALLLVVSFVAWHLRVAIRRARKSARHQATVSRPHDVRSIEYLQQRTHARSN